MKSRNGHNEIDQQVFERQAAICKAFANPTRLHLLDALAKGEQSVSDLQRELGISKPNLSQHLAVLKSAGITCSRRDGKEILCSLTMPQVKQACQIIRDVLRGQIRSTRLLDLD